MTNKVRVTEKTRLLKSLRSQYPLLHESIIDVIPKIPNLTKKEALGYQGNLRLLMTIPNRSDKKGLWLSDNDRLTRSFIFVKTKQGSTYWNKLAVLLDGYNDPL